MVIFTSLVLGDSHTGKTRSLSTLPGKSVLFNFDGPDNVTALRVPFVETNSLCEFWETKQEIERIVVANYTAEVPGDLSLAADPMPRKDLVERFIKDINSLNIHSEYLMTEENNGNLIVETVGSLGYSILDYITAYNGKSKIEIQFYDSAMKKFAAIVGKLMSYGMNVIMTGHIQAEKDEITGWTRLTPYIWGKKMPETIPRLFGEVFQTIVTGTGGTIKYQWLTKPTEGSTIGLKFLGTRKIDGLPRIIEQDFGYLDKLSKEAEQRR